DVCSSDLVPPLLLGMAARANDWGPRAAEQLRADADLTLPLLLRDMTPYLVSVLGMAAIVGAVTSSFSASILSAGSMFSWNVYRRLLAPETSVGRMKLVLRSCIVLLGVGAVVLALLGQNVKDLWFF